MNDRAVRNTSDQGLSGRSDTDETLAQPLTDEAPAAPTFGQPAEPGEVGILGPYRIVKQLGRGGMGAVYAAIDTRLNRRLALKVMLPRYAADPAARERFLREARAAAQITHDNVVTVYEADERDGVPYIAMQFLQGYPLDEYLRKKGNPSIPQVIRITREAAIGLAAAHKIGLVHRDVKPANLWLEAPHGRVKVLDFGLAKPLDAAVELTKSGAVVGTPAYMSPEQARGQKVDPRSDLFSLGAVLYRLCTGRLPFEGPTTMAVLMALGNEDPLPLRDLNPAVPAPLAALAHQLLSKKPADRPASAEEVVKRLRAIADSTAVILAAVPEAQPVSAPMQVTALPEDNPFADLDADDDTEYAADDAPAPPRKRSGRPWLWPAVGAAALAVIGALVVIIIKNKDGSEAKNQAADGAMVKGKDGKTIAQVGPATTPPAVASNPDRKAAEYALSLGGFVRVNGGYADLKAATELPKGRFTLSFVDLSGKAVSDAGLAHFKDCKGLNNLNLPNTKVTDAGLAHFKDCKALTGLDLANTMVSDAGMAHFRDCKGLTHIYLHGTKVTDAGLAHFKDCAGLTNLGLFGTAVTDAGLAHFKDCKGLTYLGLWHTKVTDSGVALFKDRKGLTDLDVRSTRVTLKGLADFHAAVPGCKIDHDGGVIEAVDVDRKAAEWVIAKGGTVRVKGQDRLIAAAAELPKERFALAWVELEERPVADAELAAFKGCASLTELALGRTKVTDAGLAIIKDFKGLTWIDLHGTAVSDAGLVHLQAFKALAHLDLGGTAVTDAGLAHLKGCAGLSQLLLHYTQVTGKGLADLKQCPVLESLILKHSQVSDAGLANLKELKGLTSLDVSGTPVSDAGLANLKDCKNLTLLIIQKTKVTAKGLEEFHAAVPACKIEHDGGVIEAKK
jgi:serine/threonine protein kinase